MQKNWRQPSPARVCSGNDDLAFSLLSLCLPAKTCRCKSGQAPGCISRIFFRQPFALFVAAPTTTTTTTTTAGPLSPPFLQPSKMSVSANYFLCRPFAWSAPLLVIISSFFATVKNYQPNLIMHTFIVWRDLHLSHCSKQGVPFKMCGFLLDDELSKSINQIEGK